MDTKEIISIIIFALTYIFIIFDFLPRTIVVIFGSTLLIIFKILTPSEALAFINWDAIALLFGMFTLVLTLKEVKFFKILGNQVIRHSKNNLLILFLALSFMSALLSAFMDSITVMLFLSTLIIEISRDMGFNPVPFLLATITSANIGGSATMVGDPPNVIIGTSLGFTFMDFVVNIGYISLIVFLINTLYFYLIFRKELAVKPKKVVVIKQETIEDPYNFYVSLIVFLFTIFLLVIHNSINLSVGIVGIIGASLALTLNGKRFANIWEKIDWDTLLFFIGLFILVGALEKTGFMGQISSLISAMIGKHPVLIALGILGFSGIVSAIMDNVPFAASMVPVIKNLSLTNNLPIANLAWALALGTDLGGNGTPIGASANVVGLSIAEKGGVYITWGYYLKKVFPSMIISLIVSSLLLYLKL